MQVADILQRRIRPRKDSSEEELSDQDSGVSIRDRGSDTESDEEEGDAPAIVNQVRKDSAVAFEHLD